MNLSFSNLAFEKERFNKSNCRIVDSPVKFDAPNSGTFGPMQVAQNLAVFFLVSQAFASLLLVIAAVFDTSTFEKFGGKQHLAIPGIRKVIRLFRNTEHNLMMGVYFLTLAFILFSYAGVVLLVIQLGRIFLSLL